MMIAAQSIAKTTKFSPILPANSSTLPSQALNVARGITGIASAAPFVSLAQSRIAEASQAITRLQHNMSPVDLGNVLRQNTTPPSQFARAATGFDINPFDDIANAAKSAFDTLRDLGGGIKDRLASLPSGAANAIADSMRGPDARKLTAGEEQKLREVFGDSIDLSNVRIVNGPGYNADAFLAFNIGGNPAITEGNTVYMRSDHFQKDFSTSPEGVEMLVHEFTHVRQYQDMGFGGFFAKYAKDLVAIGDRNKVYDYGSRKDTTFATETLEGQAEMVGDYARYKAGGNNLNQAQARDIERRLEGTGLFGL